MTRRIVEQRVRNRVIEHLQLAGSFEQQIEYSWKVPIAYVPHEVISQWEAWVPIDPHVDARLHAVYSPQEVAAMKRFHRVWLEASDALPDDYPALTDVHRLPAWLALRDEARAARSVFDSRGPISEEDEVE